MVYFVAINRAESLLQQLVKTQSNGELIFKVEKVKFDILHLRFKFRHPELQTIDTSSLVTGYHIKANSISFKAKSFIPLLLGKPVVVDSVLILNPEIDVLKFKEAEKKKVSLPEEMSKVYKSLEKVLNILQLNYLYIESGKFKIFDGSNPANKPLEVSRLNLTVNKATQRQGDNRFLFADRILLDVFNQDISLLDGLHGIRFKRFSLNTEKQTIKLDSCNIYGNQADSTRGMFNSFVDTLRISKLDLNLLANNDVLKMDSALCINPKVTFLIPLNEKQKTKISFRNDLLNKDSLDFVLKKLLGNLDIGYLTIRNAKVRIITKKGNISKVYNTSNSNFSIEKLVVNNDPKVPIKVGRFKLDVRNYVTYSPDSLYVVRFDDIQILNKKISLSNFRIGPTNANHELLSREIMMEAFEFNNINWATLLYESRIVAGNVIMVKPELHFKLIGTKKNTTDSIKQNPFSLLEEIRKKIQINDIFIEDGSIRIENLKKTFFSINHLNARLNVNQLLLSKNTFGLIDALDTLTFENGEYRDPSIQLLIKVGSFSKKNKSLRLGEIIGKKEDQSIQAKMSNVNLNGIRINGHENYSVAMLSWEKADLTMNIGKNEKVKNKPITISDNKLTIGHLTGGTTHLNFYGNNIEASSLVNHISADEIVIENNHTPRISGLIINGETFVLNQNKVKNTISDFKIQDQKISSLSNVTIRIPTNKEVINLSIPKLIFSADLYKSINGKITADFIEFQKPVISFTALPKDFINKTKDIDGGFPLMNIGRLTIDQPELTTLEGNLHTNIKIDPGKSNWNLIGLNSDNKSIKADSIRITLIQPNFRNDKISMIFTGKESVSLTGSDFAINRNGEDNKICWSVKMASTKSAGLRFNIHTKDSDWQKIAISSLDLENLILNNRNVSDIHELIQNNEQFRVLNGNIAVENSKNKVEAFNLTMDKSSNSISIDSISFNPLVDKYKFMNDRQYQGDFMQLNTGMIKVNDIDFNMLINNSVIHSKKLTINNLYFYDYKDKRLLFQHGIEKPLLTDLLKKIKPGILIDSILIKNSGILYEEFNDKTQQLGKVKLSKIRGAITGVKNVDFSSADSIKFNLYARFMDATDLRASYAQSFTDSLAGFQLKVIASSFNLRSLNPLLKPFASALIKRGYLDTIRMSVVGRKYVAYGIMKMHYHNLNIQYLNNGIEENRTLKSRLISFFANGIVNNKNLDGSGEVYAERDPEKGFVNYWVKIIIGGLFTNTGVRTDNRQERKYFQTIEKFNVPPIPNIPIDF